MSGFEIIGGTSLSGTITPQGAKNEALQVISDCLLSSQKIEIKNVPEITDVLNLIKLLKVIGVKINRKNKNHFIFQAKKIDTNYFKNEKFIKLSSKLEDLL